LLVLNFSPLPDAARRFVANWGDFARERAFFGVGNDTGFGVDNIRLTALP
jgi:hypothetical protein